MRLLLSGLLAATICAPARAEESVTPQNVWSIPPRKLPAPAHASDALRKAIEAMPQPDFAAIKALSPKTRDDWKKLIETQDAEGVKLAVDMARRLNVTVAEDVIGGAHVYRVEPPKIARAHKDHLFLHVHGGSWVFFGGVAATGEAAEIAGKLGVRVISIDYRRPPDFPAPAAVDDIVAVWREVIKTHAPSRIALGGTSAGGNLTLAATLRLKDLHLPLPAALFAGTPVIDLNKTGDSRYLNDGVDHALAWDGLTAAAAKAYAGDASFDAPLLSPVYGDVSGFPPTYLISGTRDLLLSDTVTMHAKLRKAGVDADLHVYEGLAHADFAVLFDTPEAAQHYVELEKFVLRHLKK